MSERNRKRERERSDILLNCLTHQPTVVDGMINVSFTIRSSCLVTFIEKIMPTMAAH